MVREVKISLLVVDDDPLVLEALGRYFASAEDMEVRATAENGKVALELLQEQDFDVIVADIHMPEMDVRDPLARGQQARRTTCLYCDDRDGQ